jgi:hypothetical protein
VANANAPVRLRAARHSEDGEDHGKGESEAQGADVEQDLSSCIFFFRFGSLLRLSEHHNASVCFTGQAAPTMHVARRPARVQLQ